MYIQSQGYFLLRRHIMQVCGRIMVALGSRMTGERCAFFFFFTKYGSSYAGYLLSLIVNFGADYRGTWTESFRWVDRMSYRVPPSPVFGDQSAPKTIGPFSRPTAPTTSQTARFGLGGRLRPQRGRGEGKDGRGILVYCIAREDDAFAFRAVARNRRSPSQRRRRGKSSRSDGAHKKAPLYRLGRSCLSVWDQIDNNNDNIQKRPSTRDLGRCYKEPVTRSAAWWRLSASLGCARASALLGMCVCVTDLYISFWINGSVGTRDETSA